MNGTEIKCLYALTGTYNDHTDTHAHVLLTSANDVWPLEIWPDYTDMLGGGAVEVSSACFHGGIFPLAKCKFGDTERDPVAVSR